MALVVRVGNARAEWWREKLQGLLPDIDCRDWENPGDKADVEYAVVWKPPPGGLKTFPNLKCVVSMGAGIDHVLVDPELPKHLPIIRTVGDDLRQRMREYVALHVLRHHRRLPDIQAAQQRKAWDQIITPPAPERHVAVLGLGNMGAEVARTLAGIGFAVHGWSRGPKDLRGIVCHHGEAGLADLLPLAEILVCLLPLTPATEGHPEQTPLCTTAGGRGDHQRRARRPSGRRGPDPRPRQRPALRRHPGRPAPGTAAGRSPLLDPPQGAADAPHCQPHRPRGQRQGDRREHPPLPRR